MFKITFLGVGSAFTLPEKGQNLDTCDWQSNLLVTSESGKQLLLDCGSDIRFALFQAGLSFADIDAVYVSHAHADHVGGLEGLAFTRYFSPNGKVKLFCSASISDALWNQTLRGGLESLEAKMVNLREYFKVTPVEKNGGFDWEGIHFDLVQVVHIMPARSIKHSYGLLINEPGGATVFFTSDTQFCPNQIKKFYEMSSLVLHDCETTVGFMSGVHAHYNDLKTLPKETRAKMILYHYQPGTRERIDPAKDGFACFAVKGTSITVDKNNISY